MVILSFWFVLMNLFDFIFELGCFCIVNICDGKFLLKVCMECVCVKLVLKLVVLVLVRLLVFNLRLCKFCLVLDMVM